MLFTRLSPNLLVEDLPRSLQFYTQVLGFELGLTIPEEPPYTWATIVNGDVELMLQSRQHPKYPEFEGQAVGGTLTFYITVVGIERLYTAVQGQAEIRQPLYTKEYGVREFEIADPDGYILRFAEAV